MEEYNFEKLNEIWQRIHNLMLIRESNKDGLSYDEELEYLEKYLEFFNWEDEQDLYKNINKVETKEDEMNYLKERIDILYKYKEFSSNCITELSNLFFKYPLSYTKHSLLQDELLSNKYGLPIKEIILKMKAFRTFNMFNFWQASLRLIHVCNVLNSVELVNLHNLPVSYNLAFKQYDNKEGIFCDKPRFLP